MTQRSSRLHTLERGLKAPRKSRAKARALTVMRLEDGATGVQPSHRTARLPKDIEDQIAVVRGRAVGKPSRGLLQLEERLLRTQEVKPALAVIQRHDHAAPSRVMINPQDASASRARALGIPNSSETFGGHYNVETFEESSAASPRTEVSAGTPPQTVSIPKTELQAGALPATIQWPGATAPVAGEVPWTTPRTDHSAGAFPWAEEQSHRAARKRSLTPDQKAAADSFERDVAAMLGATAPSAPEDKQWDDTLRNVAGTAPVTTAPAAGTPAVSPAPLSDAHAVFNQMGLAMNYANRFDLGAVDLSARFDQFDNELAVVPIPAAAASKPVPVQALALDDFDLVADLAELSGAQSVPTPLAEELANQSTPNPEQAMTPAI